jgi:hypothetical protein
MKRTHFLRIMVSMAVVAVLAITLHAYVVWNDIPPAFDTTERMAMDDLTVEGTSYFLLSNADAFRLLYEVEIGYGYGKQFNFTLARELIGSAIQKLEAAKTKYREILARSLNADYVDTIVKDLKGFNYESFARENGLNGEVMKELKGFLIRGDIQGLYQRNIENIQDIDKALNGIQNQLDQEIQPEVSSFWTIIHRYSDAILLGNYATMVFVAIQ